MQTEFMTYSEFLAMQTGNVAINNKIEKETYEKYNPDASKEYFVYIKAEKGKLPDFYTNPYTSESEQSE